MDTLEFLKLTQKEIPLIELGELPTDPIDYAEASFIKLPLYGELLGIETVIFSNFSDLAKKLNAKLNVVAGEVQKKFHCKRQDIVSEVIESLTSNGFYSVLRQGEVKPFSTKGLEPIIALMKLKPYAPDTLLSLEDQDDALRVLAYEMAANDGLDLVQGSTVEEKIQNISFQLPLIPDYYLKTVDINEVLSNYPGIYDEYDSYLFANSPDILLRILLYTRLGISHDVLRNLRVSDIGKLRDKVADELPKQVDTKTNTNKGKSKKENMSDSDDTKSDQLDGGANTDPEAE